MKYTWILMACSAVLAITGVRSLLIYRKKNRHYEHIKVEKGKKWTGIILILISVLVFYISPYVKGELSLEEEKETVLFEIPSYTGEPYVEINENRPYFTEEELSSVIEENFSPLDELGRCGKATYLVSEETFPDEERTEIDTIRPSGWHSVRYDDLIESNFLYNRCHLVAFALCGENANALNLITGTSYMNLEGMLPWEEKVLWYLNYSDNHVLYRVTPVFEGKNLVCSGVLMEARSIEDEGISFCIYCFNVQPGIEINYRNGESKRKE